ncbi:hypothetical protein [Rhodothermus marinus]|nr:hypothetical protein [Rhodothermus marinus]
MDLRIHNNWPSFLNTPEPSATRRPDTAPTPSAPQTLRKLRRRSTRVPKA